MVEKPKVKKSLPKLDVISADRNAAIIKTKKGQRSIQGGDELLPDETDDSAVSENKLFDAMTNDEKGFARLVEGVIEKNKIPENVSAAERENIQEHFEKVKTPEYNDFEAVVYFLTKYEGQLPEALKENEAAWREFFLTLPDPPPEGMVSDVETGPELPRIRGDIVSAALDVVDSTDFRGPPLCVDGGNLACAYVVTSVLANAGQYEAFDPEIAARKEDDHLAEHVRITSVSSKLSGMGWGEHPPDNYTPQPGDVVVWVRASKNGRARAGHAHIGIVVDENGKCVSNNSASKSPKVHSTDYRKIDFFLSPPASPPIYGH